MQKKVFYHLVKLVQKVVKVVSSGEQAGSKRVTEKFIFQGQREVLEQKTEGGEGRKGHPTQEQELQPQGEKEPEMEGKRNGCCLPDAEGQPKIVLHGHTSSYRDPLQYPE